MDLPYSYYQDEVRDDFYVPSLIKCAWAAQLEIMEDVADVCRKHGIQYFAEWGTLLGAVRHNGFIPWDDDFDIVMKREDYVKFCKEAAADLPDCYSLINIHTEDGFSEFLTRLVNSRGINFHKTHLDKFHQFPFVAGIDIFVLDCLAPSEEENEKQMEWIGEINVAVSKCKEGLLAAEDREKEIQKVERRLGVKIDRQLTGTQQLYAAMEHIFAMYDSEVLWERGEVTLMPLWYEGRTYKFPAAYYHEAYLCPFEMTRIPVPVYYDAILKKKYGEYVRLVRKGSSHDYPYFKDQISILEEHQGRKITRTEWKEEYLKEKQPLKCIKREKAGQYVDILGKALELLGNALSGDQAALAFQLLEQSQNIAVRFGTWMEEMKGEGFAPVHTLEEYCELLFELHEALKESQESLVREIFAKLEDRLAEIGRRVEEDLLGRKEVVFLPCRPAGWKAFEKAYERAGKDGSSDVYVIPVPYYDKTPNGVFGDMHYEMEGYPPEVAITGYDTYDFGKRMPDEIYIQQPYDAVNYVFSVHPFFYAENLRKITDKLVYIPALASERIEPEDERSISNLQYYVTAPGVIYSDEVVVFSENMRSTYLGALLDYAGGETRWFWEKKLQIMDGPGAVQAEPDRTEIPQSWREMLEKADGGRKKVVLYYNSISTLLEQEEKMLEKMRKVFQLFEEKKNEILLLWRPEPLGPEFLKVLPPRVVRDYRGLIEGYCSDGFGIYDDSENWERAVKLADAYYGDAGSLVRHCILSRIPVMLQNADCL